MRLMPFVGSLTLLFAAGIAPDGAFSAALGQYLPPQLAQSSTDDRTKSRVTPKAGAPSSPEEGSFRLENTTPRTGTPQREREDAYSERREREIKRLIDGICKGC
jgi:hypothetical protein